MQGKTVIITGGGSGFGRETAIKLAEQGVNISVVDLSKENGEETVRLCQEKGADALFIQADVSNVEDVKQYVAETLDRFGRINLFLFSIRISFLFLLFIFFFIFIFIYPLFIVEKAGVKEEVPSMPGVYQMSLDYLEEELNELDALGIRAVILFGVPNEKDELGKEAYNEEGIVQQAIRQIKKTHPTPRPSARAATQRFSTASAAA